MTRIAAGNNLTIKTIRIDAVRIRLGNSIAVKPESFGSRRFRERRRGFPGKHGASHPLGATPASASASASAPVNNRPRPSISLRRVGPPFFRRRTRMASADAVCAALIRSSIHRRIRARIRGFRGAPGLLLSRIDRISDRLLQSRLLRIISGEILSRRHSGRRLHSAFDGQRRTGRVGVAPSTVGSRFRPDRELGTDGLFAFEPGHSDYLLNLRSVEKVVGKHGQDQILAVLGNAAEVLPGKRQVLLGLENDSVLKLFVEGHRAGDEDVENDSDRPNVGLGRTVLLAGEDFGSRVRFGTAECGTRINGIGLGETKVADFHVELIVDE